MPMEIMNTDSYNYVRFLTIFHILIKPCEKKIIAWAKQATQMLLLLLAISLAVDTLRAPKLPIQAAQTALPIVPRSPDAAPLTTTLQAASQNQTLLLYIWGRMVRHL